MKELLERQPVRVIVGVLVVLMALYQAYQNGELNMLTVDEIVQLVLTYLVAGELPRRLVTPVASPRDNSGNPMVAVPQQTGGPIVNDV